MKKSGNNILNMVSNFSNTGKKMIDNVKLNIEIDKIRKRQDEHKYNIGKMIYENKMKTDDRLINSNIKTINDIKNS